MIFTLPPSFASTQCLSVTASGRPADGTSFAPACSDDGRFVAFASSAADLVEGDSNRALDVFLRDRERGATRLVSVDSSGHQGAGDSSSPVISAAGRFVAFASLAPNLVEGDSNGTLDVFVHDTATGSTQRASLGPDGAQANGASHAGGLSLDGRFLAFTSEASNLVAGDTNATWDVFVRDLSAGRTRRVSVGADGLQADGPSLAPLISADGRFVAFQGFASNWAGAAPARAIGQVYLHELADGRTRLISIAGSGARGDDESRPTAISADGRFVAFASFARNLVSGDDDGASDVFVRDLREARTECVTLSLREPAFDAALSPDGRFLAFVARSPGSAGVQGLHWHDRATGEVRGLSLAASGAASADAHGPRLTADGRSVLFASPAPELVPGDSNGTTDVFLREFAEAGEGAEGLRGS